MGIDQNIGAGSATARTFPPGVAGQAARIALIAFATIALSSLVALADPSASIVGWVGHALSILSSEDGASYVSNSRLRSLGEPRR
jgi:hypothetical protein